MPERACIDVMLVALAEGRPSRVTRMRTLIDDSCGAGDCSAAVALRIGDVDADGKLEVTAETTACGNVFAAVGGEWVDRVTILSLPALAVEFETPPTRSTIVSAQFTHLALAQIGTDVHPAIVTFTGEGPGVNAMDDVDCEASVPAPTLAAFRYDARAERWVPTTLDAPTRNALRVACPRHPDGGSNDGDDFQVCVCDADFRLVQADVDTDGDGKVETRLTYDYDANGQRTGFDRRPVVGAAVGPRIVYPARCASSGAPAFQCCARILANGCRGTGACNSAGLCDPAGAAEGALVPGAAPQGCLAASDAACAGANACKVHGACRAFGGVCVSRADVPVTACHATSVTGIVATASSEHKATPPYRFAVAQLVDGNVATSWQPQSTRGGVGEKIVLKLPHRVRLARLEIANGFQLRDRLGDLWRMNNRVREVAVRAGGVTLVTPVADEATSAVVLPLPPVDADTIELEILAATRGTRWADLAISELRVFGCAP